MGLKASTCEDAFNLASDHPKMNASAAVKQSAISVHKLRSLFGA